MVTPLGFSLQRHQGPTYGDHLVLRNIDGRDRVVLAGHMDTTFIDYAELPSFHVDGAHAVGPGTADMRGGLVVLVEALRGLDHLGLLASLPVTLIFNTDEERGSSTSHRIFTAEAARAPVRPGVRVRRQKRRGGGGAAGQAERAHRRAGAGRARGRSEAEKGRRHRGDGPQGLRGGGAERRPAGRLVQRGQDPRRHRGQHKEHIVLETLFERIKLTVLTLRGLDRVS